MSDRFILAADGKTPVPEPDLMKWAQWFESANRHVANDEVGPIRVSTVFLGLDHSFRDIYGGDREPILWETMIFGVPGKLNGYQCRYASYDDAVRGHAEAVEQARKALATPEAFVARDPADSTSGDAS